jgi:hypothetical protein
VAQLKQREIDRIHNALRPRLGGGGAGGGTVVVTIPPHTHSADQIGSNAAGDVAAVNVQAAVEELAAEKLAIDGHIAMTGDLNMDGNDIDSAADVYVTEDVHMSGGVGLAVVGGTRRITMAGDEADGEGRIEEVNAVAFNAVTPTPEVGKAAWDDVEDVLCVFVQSGAVVLMCAAGWAVKIAANGINPV